VSAPIDGVRFQTIGQPHSITQVGNVTRLIRFLTSLFAPSAPASSSSDKVRAAAAQSVLVAASKSASPRRVSAK
jgi:hypothetical protein